MSNKLGANLTSYYAFELEPALEGVAAAGYRYVELTSIRGVVEHVPLAADTTAIDETARLLARHSRLLIGIPVVMALTVFVVTRGQSERFASHTVLYTGIVSGTSVDDSDPARRNHLAVASAFDNLLNTITSRQTIEEVALRILAVELMAAKDGPIALVAQTTDWTTDLRNLRGRNAEETLERLRSQKSVTDSPVHALLYGSNTLASVEVIRSGLYAKRVGSSDMIEIRYEGADARLCHLTLDFLLEVFIAAYRQMKETEAGRVISYFEDQTNSAQTRLRTAVNRLREFGVSNRVINYYEQTKAIAGQKEQIDQDLQSERMRLQAAEAALVEIEQSLSRQDSLFTVQQSVLSRRRELADLATERVLRSSSDPTSPASVQVAELEQALQSDLVELYRLNRSREGIARADLVQNWMSAVIEAAEARTRVTLLTQRYDDYQKVYDEFAPLGSSLSSLEREVDIAENEYLELLHSLNLARMRQQSIELSASINVVDAPFLPDRPMPSKRLLLVVAAFMAGLLLSVGGVIAADQLDQSLRTPLRAGSTTGLAVATALPSTTAGKRMQASHVADLMTRHLIRTLELTKRPPTEGERFVAVVGLSPLDGPEGVARALSEAYARTCVDSETTTAIALDGHQTSGTAPGDALFATADLPVPGPGFSPPAVRVLPELLARPESLGLVRGADAVVLAVGAGRTWSAADRRITDDITAAHGCAPLLVLTNATEPALEEIVGEIPKKRSRFRRTAKRLLRFEFRP